MKLNKRSFAALIPSRYGSTRFPGKPLAPICGKPMVLHVCERALESQIFEKIVVVTDHQGIFNTVVDAGFEALMSPPNLETGTDRCAYASRFLPESIGYILNLQGDEPFISPSHLIRLAGAFKKKRVKMATLMTPLSDRVDSENPNVVKVVANLKGEALYFSRSKIPFSRVGGPNLFRHLGVYGFEKSFLIKFSNLSPTPLSIAESLEQLRALEHGYSVHLIEVAGAAMGVDSPEDLKNLENLQKLIQKQAGKK